MRVNIVGGGPGGLYTALLLRKADPTRQVTVFDRNPPDATYGWGVVFSDETLGFLAEADAETHRAILRSFVHWECIDILYRGQTIRSCGHAFSGVARSTLLQILQERCRELGVDLRFRTEITDVAPLMDADLVVAADGLNSVFRTAYADVFHPSFDVHRTKFIWLGVHLPLKAFTFVFRETEWGMFQVHAYPFSPDLSTWIVECNEDVWRRAGLDGANEAESVRFCGALYADVLAGRPLLSNRSTWINFTTLRNDTWRMRNLVLLGDAAHTAHFSIGSGTKMAMEDAIALSDTLDTHDDLDSALLDYEELRQGVVERTQAAARDSSLWFENTGRYAKFHPIQFAFSLLTRSRRITYDNLRLRDPHFSDRVDRWFQADATSRENDFSVSAIHRPAENPLSLAGTRIRRRLVAIPLSSTPAVDGTPSDSHIGELEAAALGGAAVIFAPAAAVSLQGRITPGDLGLWPENIPAWEAVTNAIHRFEGCRLAVRLVHAGRRGSTRWRTEGTDIPLRQGNWPLISPSPIPYTRWSQTPREMNSSDMEAVRDAFVQATCCALNAGIDLVEIHMGQGYLLGSFLSPLTNCRDDEYGGSLENRMRFPLAVFSGVRDAWTLDRPLSVCLGVTDWAKGGMTLDDGVAIARALVGLGCDLIHVVSGGTTANANPPYGRVWQVPLSDRVRNDAAVPTIVEGQITSLHEVNTILAAGRADLCVLTRW